MTLDVYHGRKTTTQQQRLNFRLNQHLLFSKMALLYTVLPKIC